MKFEKTKDKDLESRDASCLRRFLAGDRTLFTRAFWENGPRGRVKSTSNGRGDNKLMSKQGPAVWLTNS